MVWLDVQGRGSGHRGIPRSMRVTRRNIEQERLGQLTPPTRPDLLLHSEWIVGHPEPGTDRER
jgi:hypothetical protein